MAPAPSMVAERSAHHWRVVMSETIFTPATVRQFVEVARDFTDAERRHVYDFARYLWLCHFQADHFHCCGPGATPDLSFEEISDHLRNVWLTVAGNAYAVQRDAVAKSAERQFRALLGASDRNN